MAVLLALDHWAMGQPILLVLGHWDTLSPAIPAASMYAEGWWYHHLCGKKKNLHIEAQTKWPPFSRRHFQWIFLNENVSSLIKISLKFVPKGPIHNIPTLVQIMAWRRPGDKPLSQPMMVCLLTHISSDLNELILNLCDDVLIKGQSIPIPFLVSLLDNSVVMLTCHHKVWCGFSRAVSSKSSSNPHFLCQRQASREFTGWI